MLEQVAAQVSALAHSAHAAQVRDQHSWEGGWGKDTARLWHDGNTACAEAM